MSKQYYPVQKNIVNHIYVYVNKFTKNINTFIYIFCIQTTSIEGYYIIILKRNTTWRRRFDHDKRTCHIKARVSYSWYNSIVGGSRGLIVVSVIGTNAARTYNSLCPRSYKIYCLLLCLVEIKSIHWNVCKHVKRYGNKDRQRKIDNKIIILII